MKITFSKFDKLLSIFNSSISIFGILYTYYFRPEMYNIVILCTIILIAITIVYLTIRVYVLSRKIQSTSKEQDIMKKIITQNKERIERYEQLLNV